MNDTRIKYAAAAALYLLWAALVWSLKLAPDDLISTIKWGLLWLAGFHTVTNLQGSLLAGQTNQQSQNGGAVAHASKEPPTIPLKETP